MEPTPLTREDIPIGGIYMDKNGKKVRVTAIEKERVTWVDLDERDTGTTNIDSFIKNYHPVSTDESRAA